MNNIDKIHVYLFLFLIILPYILKRKQIKKYGIYFSIFMTIVIIGWLFNNGMCILTNKNQKIKYKYGLTPAFFNEYFNVSLNNLKNISKILEILYGISAYILASSNKLLQKTIIIIVLANLFINYK